MRTLCNLCPRAAVFLLLVAACVASCTPILDETPIPRAKGDHSRDWRQTSVADFGTGTLKDLVVTDAAGGQLELAPGATTGVYTSTVVTTVFTFNAIASHWTADLPQGSTLRLEVRFGSMEQDWSPWYPVDDAEWVPNKGEFYPETPLLVSDGHQLQYRVTLRSAPPSQGGAAPSLDQVTLTYIDTSLGPTTAQAKVMTKMGEPTVQGIAQPGIIPRAGWGADEDLRTWAPEYRYVRKIVVHHTVTPNDYAEEQSAAWVRAIYYYHAVTLEWGDIGYNYLVDRFGNIYEGRYGGPGVVGGHVYHYNYGSVGVGVIGTHGNYSDSVPPSQKTLSALVDLSTWEASRSSIYPLGSENLQETTVPNLAGHRDYPPNETSCPGNDLYATLPALRQATWERLRPSVPLYGVAWMSSGELPPVVLTGTTYTTTVRAVNAGSLIWPKEGLQHPVRLGYHWLDETGQTVAQPPEADHRMSLARDLAFGEVFDLVALVTTPAAPGTYTLVWDMVHEGVSWFHNMNPDSPLLTATASVVDTLPATATVEPTATPIPCVELLENGGFEREGHWSIFDTSYPARYVDHPTVEGSRALQTGIGEGNVNPDTYSSAEQTIVLPPENDIPPGGSLTLRYWYWPQVATGDRAYVLFQAEGGEWTYLQNIKEGAAGWVQAVHKLDAYAGEKVTLRYGTYNDGLDGTSVMYVDDVSITLCREGAVLPTPTRLPTATATVTDEPTPTPSPRPTGTPTATAEPTSTWTPVPPTPEPTPTETPIPPTLTATLTPTATPTPEATPRSCADVAVNGDFESALGWTISTSPHQARYTESVSRTGSRSMQMGISDRLQNQFSYSSIEQQFGIPGRKSVILTFWYYVPYGVGDGDYGYVLARAQGRPWAAVGILSGSTSGWTRFQADVTRYAGKAFTLRLGMRNDGDWDGAAGVMYVDSLTLEVCDP